MTRLRKTQYLRTLWFLCVSLFLIGCNQTISICKSMEKQHLILALGAVLLYNNLINKL